ncbi:MAG: hypothetical protein K9G70_01475 [Prolixibacteraceae bacterium]|nr:hypothetical protein [Prolixibacteraceae bacterium]
MKKSGIIVLFLTIVLFVNAQPFYKQRDGHVSIEAEHYTLSHGEWEEVEGRNAEPQESQGQGIDIGSKIISGRQIQLSDKEVRIGWGIPYESAIVTAYADERQLKASIFEYQSEAIAGIISFAAYRAFITWPVDEYNEQGWSMFHNIMNKIVRQNTIKKVLFVHGGKVPGEIDAQVIEWLKSLEISLETISDEDLDKIDIKKIPVIISESVSSANVGDRFKLHPMPVILGEPFVLNKMGMVISKDPWTPVEGEFGNAVMVYKPQLTDSLGYAFSWSSSTKMKVHVLAQGADKRTNESLWIKIYSAKNGNLEKELKLKLNHKMEWQSSNEFAFKEGAYLLIIQPAEETISSINSIVNRSYPSYRIDKIVLSYVEHSIDGNGPTSIVDELPNNFSERLIKECFLPTQIWKADKGVVIVEAESIDHHPNWELRQEPSGYTGKGYLSWQGPSRTQSIEMKGGNDDDMNIRQGPQEQMLIIRVKVEEDGIYCVNARNIHELEDGDNDAWVSMIGFKPWNDDAFDDRVRRMGDSHKDGKGFTWLDWGVREFPLKKGINNIYIGGRSVGFGIDRIAIYPANNKEAMERALNIESALSEEL